MRERAMLIGADLEIGSRGRGTEIALGARRAAEAMSTPLKTRVLLADDHAVVRSGLRAVLDGEIDIEVVAEASTASRRSRRRSPHEVDLAILDVSMPRMTGLQAASELRRRRAGRESLMLSVHDNERYFFEALKAGASGYVLKSAANRDLVEACRAAMRGEPFLYPRAVAALIREYLDQARRGEAAARGSADATRAPGGEADRRGYRATRSRRARDQPQDRRPPPRELLDKLGMRNVAELTRYAIRRGLIEA